MYKLTITLSIQSHITKAITVSEKMLSVREFIEPPNPSKGDIYFQHLTIN